jgi:hypothetical protein
MILLPRKKVGKFYKDTGWWWLVPVVALSITVGFLVICELVFEDGAGRFISGNATYATPMANPLIAVLYSMKSFEWVILQMVAHAIIAIGVGLITYELAGKYGLRGALLAAVTPMIFLWTASATGETPMLLFVTFGLYFTLRYLKYNKLNQAIFAGSFFGLALLSRGTLIVVPFFGVATLFIVFLLSRRYSVSRALSSAMLPFVLCFVVLGAQVARNYDSTGHLFWNYQGGIHLLEWVYPCLTNKYGCGLRDVELIKLVKVDFELEKNKLPPKDKLNVGAHNALKKKMAYERLGDLNTSRVIIAATAAYIKQLVYTPIRNVLGRMRVPQGSLMNVLFRPNKNYDYSILPVIAITLIETINVLFRVVQAIGLMVLIRVKKTREAGYFLLSYLIAALVTGIGIGNPRHRAATEVVLIPLVVIGFGAIVRWRKNRRFIYTDREALVRSDRSGEPS